MSALERLKMSSARATATGSGGSGAAAGGGGGGGVDGHVDVTCIAMIGRKKCSVQK